MDSFQSTTVFWVVFMLSCGMIFNQNAAADNVRYYDFKIEYANVSRICHSKVLVSVNGQFPGPTVYAEEGDRVVVKVTNNVQSNVTIHWHGVRQLLTGWSDGPAYITQCPIQAGQSFTHDFRVISHRGTLFWHAHISWLRATLYGAIIIYPRRGLPLPFPKPEKEFPVLLGEWWNGDVEQIEKDALRTGGVPNISDAFTINGQPGPFYNCSTADVYKLKFKAGKTYMLRMVNAALNQDLLFGIANHSLTIVEVDGEYTKPLTVPVLVLSPGQTADVLVTANQHHGRYYMAAKPYISAPVPFNPFPTTAIIEYEASTYAELSQPPVFPSLPASNDTVYGENFFKSIRSLNSKEYPIQVPQTVDRNLLFTVSFNLKACPSGQLCLGPGGLKFSSSMNNISFSFPSISIMQAYYYNIGGVFSPDFPDMPPHPFNYTGPMLSNPQPEAGTKVNLIPFGSNVQLVLQDTSTATLDSHPIHLHGYSFYVVGQGVGNYDPSKDPATFNLIDPPYRNTVAFPRAGWVAIRWKADNPGVWFMHCHLEAHTSWGMEMAFLVTNGKGKDQTLPPPPEDLPKC
ncbi:hypothetical protein O6H91_07G070600 [Diphasiastrum complanatum]|uniref:Uncharacterized protein n=1 Tax=Diphasiastrum complanatum TaxID=34168 RepID=A0ACC2D6L4_DIPCM|nr:hypothetical protein O6H91_07G070600 [Diphasiastrum complanatum]